MAIVVDCSSMWTARKLFGLSVAVRLFCILYGHLHDYFFNVKFTDIDYNVFVDGAKAVAAGDSPYNVATYRYTPFVAWILLPTLQWFNFGKFLFNTFDVAACYFLLKLLAARSRGADRRTLLASIAAALLNPLNIVVSSRGNAEALLHCMVMLLMVQLSDSRYISAALIHGFIIHFKMYPFIFLPSTCIFLTRQIGYKRTQLFTLASFWQPVIYLVIVFAELAFLNFLFYLLYGDKYLEQTLYYHLVRQDLRHNFSVYFLTLYLAVGSVVGKAVSLLAFLPQIMVILVFAVAFCADLPLCWFLTSFAFVSFNKVCTSQYFVWYAMFFPLILPYIRCWRRALSLISCWFASQGVWLAFAYLLEFRGYNMFLLLWLASIAFLVSNTWIMSAIMRAYVRNKNYK